MYDSAHGSQLETLAEQLSRVCLDHRDRFLLLSHGHAGQQPLHGITAAPITCLSSVHRISAARERVRHEQMVQSRTARDVVVDVLSLSARVGSITDPPLMSSLTFRRVFPVVLLSMIFVLAVRQSVSLDPDLWWHLKTGEQIIDAHSIPHVDDFSFTKQGSEWVAHEWLSEVIIAGIYRLSGFVG